MRRLIIRPGAIGDCILSFPAIEFLQGSGIDVWISRPCVPLTALNAMWRVRAIEDSGLYRPVGLTGLAEKLRAFDAIDSWYGAKLDEFRDWVARERLPFRFHQALPDTDSGLPATDFFLGQVGAPLGGVPRIAVPGATREQPGFVAMHPFSGSPRKNWPLERFAELARMLPLEVRWTAGAEEPLDDAHRFDSLYDLACWLKGATLYAGNDSGITHLAAAIGVPVVAIFRASDPAVWAPRGPASITVLGGNGGEDVSVAHAFAACRRLLDPCGPRCD